MLMVHGPRPAPTTARRAINAVPARCNGYWLLNHDAGPVRRRDWYPRSGATGAEALLGHAVMELAALLHLQSISMTLMGVWGRAYLADNLTRLAQTAHHLLTLFPPSHRIWQMISTLFPPSC